MSQYQKYQTLYVIKDIPDSAVHSKGDDKTMFALKGADCQFITERHSPSGWIDVWFKGNPIYCLPAEYFSATPPEADEPNMEAILEQVAEDTGYHNDEFGDAFVDGDYQTLRKLYDDVNDLLDKERADNVTLRAELTAARQQRIQAESNATALVVAFKRVSEIVSHHYGEDESEDSDELNDCFDVLQNADAGAAILDALKPFAAIAKGTREDRYSVHDTLSVSVMYKWLADAEKALKGK